MTDLRGQIIPETDEEWDLVEEVYTATAAARHEGVERREIVTILNFAAASIATAEPEDLADGPDGSERVEQTRDCPLCDREIERVIPALGGEYRIVPCHHHVASSELEGWVDGP